MLRVFHLVLFTLTLRAAPGWWEQAQKPEEPRPIFTQEPRRFAVWLYNVTTQSNFTSEDFMAWAPESWDGWLWLGLDALGSTLGWLIFGRSWTQVKSGFSFLVRLGALLMVCISVHYVLALCWPIVSLMVGMVATAIWVVRNLIRCCGRAAFYTQRWSGGVPEALGATFIGPEVGESPEASELRKLKKSGDNERWILIRRSGATAIFKVQESSSIKSSGLFMTLEPGTLRGDTLQLWILCKDTTKFIFAGTKHARKKGPISNSMPWFETSIRSLFSWPMQPLAHTKPVRSC